LDIAAKKLLKSTFNATTDYFLMKAIDWNGFLEKKFFEIFGPKTYEI
jgi:hypothetical protein